MCKFIDYLFDLGVFVYNERPLGYTVHGKPWLKAKIHAYLK